MVTCNSTFLKKKRKCIQYKFWLAVSSWTNMFICVSSVLFQFKYKWVTWTKFLLKCKETTNLYWQLPSFSSKVTWIEMLEDTNPVPHVELLDISQRKCTFLSNTVMWYLILLIIDISSMEFDDICFTFPCRLMFVHVKLFCFLTHQFIGF